MKRTTLLVIACLVLTPLLGYVVHANFSDHEEDSTTRTAFYEAATVDPASVPNADEMEKLAKADPVAFFDACLDRYRKEVKGYHCIMHKHERIGGKLNKPEEMEVFFRDSPHAVLLIWRKNPQRADRALYVEGQNNNKLLVRPKGGIARLAAGDIAEREVNGEDAKNSGRSTLDQFGMKKILERSRDGWKAAKANGTLRVTYKGIEKVPQTGNKPCYHLHRVCAAPETDGVMAHSVYIDTESLLLVGSRSLNKDGGLIGEYFFRDIKLNPDFKADQFTRAALSPE
jgi:hypothetical protein